MALPMDEQRILEEMERMLAADDPKLAARLAAFGQPGFGAVLRTRRARATLSVMVLVLIAAVAAVIYMMSALRPSATNGHRPPSAQHTTRPPGRPSTHSAGHRVIEPPPVRGSGAAGLWGQRGGTVPRGGVAQCAATFAPACGHWAADSATVLARPAPRAARS